MDRSLSSRIVSTTGLLVAAATLLFGSALAGLTEPVASLFRYIPKDYNEGWNAYWADAAWKGGVLYPAADSTVANNYPPLSFYVVGALGHIIGDNIFAGRILALAALIAVTVGICFWLRAAGVSRASVMSASLFIAAFIAYAPGYVAMDDPQLLAHALMVAAGLVLWRSNFSPGALAAAAFLLLLGGLTKHLLIPLPLAITAWLAIYRRECLLRWLGLCLAFLATAVAILAWRYTSMFHNMSAPRVYSTHLARNALHRTFRQLPLVLIIGSLGCVGACMAPSKDNPNKQFAVFVLIYLLLAWIFGILAAMGAGVDRNAFFDVLIATSLAVGTSLDALLSRPTFSVKATVGALLAGLILPLVIHAGSNLHRSLLLVKTGSAREASYVTEVTQIKQAAMGSAACEMLSLCYWAGQPFAVDFFNYGQKLQKDESSTVTCDQVFANGSIKLLQLEAPSGKILSRSLPERCNRVIEDHFVPVLATASGELLKRRP